ncbi:hypothetical protein [Amnibacterium sp.]|uniref:hypothetical protein n=1 Tax=Amnibacterium sp. TaxID=1872496 RepID=UPI002629D1A7|nr:hypothetical protein [Amnibacterium sp.]MCU1473995.1 hypothetical protein [Amnibacterium sp.]
MIDDDAFDGFGAIMCRECGTSLDLRWRRTRVTFDCRECGTSITVARRAPHRSWFPRPAARVETAPTTIPTGAPTA